MATVLFLGARPLVSLVYGPGMTAAVVPLRLLSVGLLPAVANHRTLLDLYSRSSEREVLRCVGAALCLNVALNLLLVPFLGASGAAVSLTVSEWGLFILYHNVRQRSGTVPFPGVLGVQES